MPPKSVLRKPVIAAIDETLSERGSRYGASYSELSALSQQIKDVFRAAPNWESLAPDMRESLELIALKIARILYGDANYADNWHDIIGYAKLIDDRL